MTVKSQAVAELLEEAAARLVALKARDPREIRAEARLRERMGEVLGPLVDRVVETVERSGAILTDPDDPRVVAMFGDLKATREALMEVLTEEVGEETLRVIESIERRVTEARRKTAKKAIPDELRPKGMDRILFETMSRLAASMLTRFRKRVLDRLVEAADVDMPPRELRSLLSEMLNNEIRQMARHATGDARNEATMDSFRRLGVRRHRWVTAGDDAVREEHAAVDGEVVEVGERFSNGRIRPGGLGCRCHLEPVLEE